MTFEQTDVFNDDISPAASSNAENFHAELLSSLIKKRGLGEKLNGFEITSFLQAGDDNTVIRDWLATAGVMSKFDFNRAMKKHAHDAQIRKALGFVPKTVQDFVAGYAKENGITVGYNGLLHRKSKVMLGEDEITEVERQASPAVDTHWRLKCDETGNLDEYRRDLRLLRDDLALSFRDQSIEDAVQTWASSQRKECVRGIFYKIVFAKGPASGPEGQEMWRTLEEAAFDVSDAEPGFAVAVLKKFMWQVKRKMLGLPITDHLMPVFTGAQGTGKSTLVRNLLQPLDGCVANSDFRQITDDRNIQLWDSYVVFLDEMGFAKKAEMDEVKNIITSEVLTRRPMRTNDMVSVKQRATFIGCSNKQLSQLIRDETGIRRFAELSYRNDPDWQAINDINWKFLWSSVDERGDDPSRIIKECLARQQAANRTMSTVETWAREGKTAGSTWTGAAVLHQTFREWEDQAFPKSGTDLTAFGREMQRLIRSEQDFPWVVKKSNAGMKYQRRGG